MGAEGLPKVAIRRKVLTTARRRPSPKQPGTGRRRHRAAGLRLQNGVARGGALRPATCCNRCGMPLIGRQGIPQRLRSAMRAPSTLHDGCQQFDHGSLADQRGGHSLCTGIVFRQPGLIPADELPEFLVAPNLSSERVVDHDLPGPYILEKVTLALLDCPEVLGHRVSWPAARVAARQLDGTDEIRKPGHRDTTLPGGRHSRRLPSLPSGNILIPNAARTKGVRLRGGWCARPGRVYDLYTAVVSSPLPRPRRQKPPGVTGTGG